MQVGMGAWVELRRFAQVRSQEKQQEMEEQFISNLFSSYQGHLKWNPIPHKDFLTREFANMLLSFNGSSVAIHSPDSISLDFELHNIHLLKQHHHFQLCHWLRQRS
jgi:hypothetical protein